MKIVKVKKKEMGSKLDLSKPNCHVCGKPLKRDFENKREWCGNANCQIYNMVFSIPYKTKTKAEATVKEVIVGSRK